MAYDGIEIDMLALGDADSILVTRWTDGKPLYVLIDGGYAKDAPIIEAFLTSRGVERTDHLVCSHIHNDHVQGLRRLVRNNSFEIGTAWVHLPEYHVTERAIAESKRKAASFDEMMLITASIEAEQGLVQALNERNIKIIEPFAKQEIGPLLVCGPTEDYYASLVPRFTDIEKIRQLNEELKRQKTASARARDEAHLEEHPKTQPENLTSTILATVFDGKTIVLTADAGAESLMRAANQYELANCHWLQIPHHGSRNNMTQALVDHLCPKTAFISAEGNVHHPNSAVVSAFKGASSIVYSTHRDKRHLWFHLGDVPPREDYVDAQPL